MLAWKVSRCKGCYQEKVVGIRDFAIKYALQFNRDREKIPKSLDDKPAWVVEGRTLEK